MSEVTRGKSKYNAVAIIILSGSFVLYVFLTLIVSSFTALVIFIILH